MWLTPKLISECISNSNFSANYEDNENDQDNENQVVHEISLNFAELFIIGKYVKIIKMWRAYFRSLCEKMT